MIKLNEKQVGLFNADCLEILKILESNSIDACITDPPAGISFMNKSWDSDKGGRDEWMKWLTEVFTEVLRVLKPGAHGLVWSLPRTSHWTAMALENAGFEIRDCVYHIQSQGFPKSLNVSKGIDKKYGAERKIIGAIKKLQSYGYSGSTCYGGDIDRNNVMNITAPATDLAKKYDGYGSQLKPAVETWWLIRKPLSEKSIVDNVLKHGTGAINIDKSRIGIEERSNPIYSNGGDLMTIFKGGELKWSGETKTSIGRFPANLIHDGSDAVLKEFEKYGESKSSKAEWKPMGYNSEDSGWKRPAQDNYQPKIAGYDDTGSVARFFYCSKASVSERNLGLDGFEGKTNLTYGNGGIISGQSDYKRSVVKNNHPTVKSVKLMSYLVNLITPPIISGNTTPIVLDCFLGSGTTGIAALLNGYDFIGIEMNEEYYKIAESRINNYEEYRKYLK